MKNRIAVEGTLSDIARDLKARGYDVVDLNDQLEEVGAVVVSGEDNNVMDMLDIKTLAPVINARGMTAEEVCSELENRY